MIYNPEKHHRRSIRLKGYDYSQAGAYFITICVQNRLHLFGNIEDGVMNLNPAGQMVERWWQEVPHKFPTLEIDEYVVMPNHFHAIIVIDDQSGGSHQAGGHIGPPLPRPPDGNRPNFTVGTIMQWFKTMTTNEYIRHVKQDRWTPFPGKLWQRDYFEHIVRNQESLNRIRAYIASNPATWDQDRENR